MNIRNTNVLTLFVLSLVMAPVLVFAQTQTTIGIVERIGNIVFQLTPIIVGLALLVFIWGLVKFIAGAGNEEKRSEGRQVMGWGIIALFVIVSIWGIVRFVSFEILGTYDPQQSVPAPFIQGLPTGN